MEPHEFIQDVCLDGQGNVAQHKIEEGMEFARMGMLG
jgi:hypothetical protein